MAPIKIVNFNIQGGLLEKKAELISFLNVHNIEIAVLTETYLRANKAFNVPGYKVYRHDRETDSNRCSGGVAILVNKNLDHSALPQSNINTEHVSIMLHGRRNTIITGIYVRPNKLDPQDILAAMHPSTPSMLIGDLNSKSPLWNCPTYNKEGKILEDTITSNGINVVYPNQPTRRDSSSTIDIILTKHIFTGSLSRVFEGPPSDHMPTITEIDLGHTHKPRNRKVCDWKNANWKLFKQHINARLTITETYEHNADIDYNIEELQTLISEAAKASIQSKTVKDSPKYIPSQLVRALITRRNTARRAYQDTGEESFRTQRNTLTKEIQKTIESERQIIWGTYLLKQCAKPHGLWAVTKMLKNKHHNIPALTVNGTMVTDNTEKANAIADAFEISHQIGNSCKTTLDTHRIKQRNDTLLETELPPEDTDLCTNSEILGIIKRLKIKKAAGHDQITNRHIKNLPRKVITQLKNIFNYCLLTGYFPQIWKTSKVIAIHKAGKDEKQATSYRPISLLSSLSKILEKLIHTRLVRHLNENTTIPETQHGFRERHSTIDQLQRITHHIKTNLRKRRCTQLVALDIEKAFDSVWHQQLISKLCDIKTPTYICKIIQNYLSGRQFYTNINDASSSTRQIPAGVPQGSILGPTLFITYIHDAPKLPYGVEIATYADDTAVFVSYGKQHDFYARDRLEKGLDTIQKYLCDNKIKINEAKTETITFSHKPHIDSQAIRFKGQLLQPKKSIKYLGIKLDSKLNYIAAINHRLQLAQHARIKLLPVLLSNDLPLEIKTQVYNMIIRSTALYGAQLFCTASNAQLEKIQRFQNHVLRSILKENPETPIQQLHTTTQVPTIEEFIKKLSIKHINRALTHTNSLIKNSVKTQTSRQQRFQITKNCLPYEKWNDAGN